MTQRFREAAGKLIRKRKLAQKGGKAEASKTVKKIEEKQSKRVNIDLCQSQLLMEVKYGD